MVAFLRHVGCPFAELTVKRLRSWAAQHPTVAVFVVNHGDHATTQQWLQQIGGLGRLQLIQDPERQLYAQWGLGYSSFWHFAGLPSVLGVMRLTLQGIRNRDASGTRWQRSGMFLIKDDKVVWQHIPYSAQEFVLPPPETLVRATKYT